MLGALYESATAAMDRIAQLTAPIAEVVAPVAGGALEVWSVMFPYLVKAFHYGFIPLVLVLGMNTTPKPKLTDLLTPM